MPAAATLKPDNTMPSKTGSASNARRAICAFTAGSSWRSDRSTIAARLAKSEKPMPVTAKRSSPKEACGAARRTPARETSAMPAAERPATRIASIVALPGSEAAGLIAMPSTRNSPSRIDRIMWGKKPITRCLISSSSASGLAISQSRSSANGRSGCRIARSSATIRAMPMMAPSGGRTSMSE